MAGELKTVGVSTGRLGTTSGTNSHSLAKCGDLEAETKPPLPSVWVSLEETELRVRLQTRERFPGEIPQKWEAMSKLRTAPLSRGSGTTCEGIISFRGSVHGGSCPFSLSNLGIKLISYDTHLTLLAAVTV